jgi:hypothetical protein
LVEKCRLPKIWLDESIMLETPMQGPELDCIWVHTGLVLSKTYSSLYLKRGYQLWNTVIGLGRKLRAISQYLARWVVYNARINHAKARTRWDLG